MTQVMTTTGYGATYLPLLAVQQRSHSRIYPIPAREYASAELARAANDAARARLRGPIALAAPKPPAPAAAPEAKPQPAMEVGDGVPLNMLLPCHWRFLVALAALRHGCTAEQVTGRAKPKPVAAARREAYYLVALHTVFSTARIGRMFGRDHTTILSALKNFPPIVRPRVSALAATPAIQSPGLKARIRIVQEGYAAGLPVSVIAEQIGMSRSTVKQDARRYGFRHPAKPFYGDDEEASAQ